MLYKWGSRLARQVITLREDQVVSNVIGLGNKMQKIINEDVSQELKRLPLVHPYPYLEERNVCYCKLPLDVILAESPQ